MWMTLAALGANLAGNLLRTGSERARMKKVAELQKKYIEPLEQRAGTLAAGLSRGEAGMVQGVTNQSLTSLAQRGVLDSSIASGELASRISPILEAAAQRRDNLTRDVTAAKMQIAGNEAPPGYAGAFGESLGQTGGYLAFMEGLKYGDQERAKTEMTGLEKVRSLFDIQEDPTGLGNTDSPLFNPFFNALDPNANFS